MGAKFRWGADWNGLIYLRVDLSLHTQGCLGKEIRTSAWDTTRREESCYNDRLEATQERRAKLLDHSLLRQRHSWVEFDHDVGETSFSPSPEETRTLYKFQFDVELKSTNTCETSVDYRCFEDKEITFTHFSFLAIAKLTVLTEVLSITEFPTRSSLTL